MKSPLKKICTLLSLIIFSLMLNVSSAAALSQQEIDKKLDDFLPKGYVREGKSAPLPQGNLKTEILPQVIKIFLQLVGAVSFAIFVYAGVMVIVAGGKEEEVTKFKKTFLWSAIGLAFITTAYALVSGLLNIVFK